MREKRDGIFIFKVKFPSGLPSPVEISNEWVLKCSSIRRQSFTLYFLTRQKRNPLKYLQDVQIKIKSVPDDRKLCVLQEDKSARVFYLLSSEFTSLVIKLLLIVLKMKI